jgi:hypothetical protein
MKKLVTVVTLIIAVVLILTGCTKNSRDVVNPSEDPAAGVTEPSDSKGREPSGENPDENAPGQSNQIDLKAVKPNEAGKIMVLMYHVIGESEGEWSRRWENFRKDLEVLYEKGYRLISLNDYLENNIRVEAGYTPLVITFDDGTQGQFNIIEKDGRLVVDPKSAVGIMEDFYNRHPDFGLEATFYVYYPIPFRQKEFVEYKLKYLVGKGMDIGNHTYGHANLGTLDGEGVQYQLGKMVADTKKYLPEYEVDSLALPYGANAKEQYREYVYRGSYQGIGYENKGVLLVGANPATSPMDKRFDPYRIPRVRATDDPAISSDMYDWLEYFDENPEERYISDGDETVVTVPREMEARVDSQKLGGKKLRVYDPE